MGRFSHYHNIQNSQSYGGFIPKIKVPWIIHFNGIFMDFPWNQPSSYWGTPSYGNPSRIEMSYATVIKHPWCTFAILKPFKTSGSNTPRLVDESTTHQEKGEYYNHLQSTKGKSRSLPVSRDAEGYKPSNYCWLVVSTPLKNIIQLGWWHSQNMESHKIYVPKHHPTIGVYPQLGNSEYLGFSHDVHEINHPAVKHGETPLPPSRPNSSVRTSASFRKNLSINWKDFHQHTMIYQLILDQFII